ncbi:MAG: hypothetical protein ACK5C8_04760 [Roseiflexaceae bacterium]|jgi:hypothetical protein
MNEQQLNMQVDAIIRRAKQASPIYLTRHVQVGVDSAMYQLKNPITGLDLSQVQLAGLNGWQVVGMIHKTASASYNHGLNHFTASGGNVIAAYVVLQLTLTGDNAELLRGEISEYVRTHLQTSLTTINT